MAPKRVRALLPVATALPKAKPKSRSRNLAASGSRKAPPSAGLDPAGEGQPKRSRTLGVEDQRSRLRQSLTRPPAARERVDLECFGGIPCEEESSSDSCESVSARDPHAMARRERALRRAKKYQD